MTNQTIDGVPRELLLRVLDPYRPRGQEKARKELRALLDSPASCDTCGGSGRFGMGFCECCQEASQPQGEPVAWQIRTKTNREASTWTEWTQCNEMERALHSHEAGKFNRFGVMREIRPVYAEQPAPVAVVRCSFCDVTDQDGNPWSGGSATQDGILIYRVIGCKDHKHLADACLAEVARLNPSL